MEPDLLTLAAIEHLPNVGLLAVACVVLWRRESRTTDKLIATLEGQTAQLGGRLTALKESVDAGITDLEGRFVQLTARIDHHQRWLDRHSRIITELSAPAQRQRPRIVSTSTEDD